VTSVVRATVDFSQRVEQPLKLFIISVGFGDDTVTLEPPIEQFLEAMAYHWEGTIGIANSIQSFNSVRQYEQYTRVLNHLPVKDVITRNRTFIKYTNKILDTISDQVDITQAYANEQYEPFRRIYQYGLDWDEEEYAEEDHSYEELYRHMGLMKEYQDDLERFKAHYVLGIISVDGKNLRGDLTPIPENALITMKRLLMNMARERCVMAYQPLTR
jgi:hypothetical protein